MYEKRIYHINKKIMIESFFPFPVKVEFTSIPIPATALLQGVPLGQGKCVGVRLYLNSLVYNTQTNTAIANNLKQIYFGDNNEQRHELLAGNYSHIIYCEDLQDVFVRGNGIANQVQVWVYTQV